MPFVSGTENYVPPEGSKDAAIAFIGEAPARDELRTGRPFMGEAGRLFEHCLHNAGIIRGQCYVSNFSKHPIGKNQMPKYFTPKTGLRGPGLECRDRLLEELDQTDCNIYVPMGNPATCALLGFDRMEKSRSITHRRGYLHSSTLPSGRTIKVLPTLHPASALYGGSFINIWYIGHDFTKVKSLSADKEFHYDPTQIEVPESFDEAVRLLEFVRHTSPLAFDVEVVNYEIASISFAISESWGCSIPFYECWSVEEEVHLWYLIALILEDKNTTKILQNGMFDIGYLFSHQGIRVQGHIVDTMIAHHIMFPDMLKSLEFLGSIYCNREYWKDMVEFSNVKKES